MPQLEQLATDPLIAPPRVLGRQPKDQIAARRRGWGTPRPVAPAEGCPFPADQLPVPAQESLRPDRKGMPAGSGETTAQGCEDQPIAERQPIRFVRRLRTRTSWGKARSSRSRAGPLRHRSRARSRSRRTTAYRMDGSIGVLRERAAPSYRVWPPPADPIVHLHSRAKPRRISLLTRISVEHIIVTVTMTIISGRRALVNQVGHVLGGAALTRFHAWGADGRWRR